MVAVPALTPVTVPLLTVATDSSLLDHVTALLAALPGSTVAVRVTVFHASTLAVVLSSVTPDTGSVPSDFTNRYIAGVVVFAKLVDDA